MRRLTARAIVKATNKTSWILTSGAGKEKYTTFHSKVRTAKELVTGELEALEEQREQARREGDEARTAELDAEIAVNQRDLWRCNKELAWQSPCPDDATKQARRLHTLVFIARRLHLVREFELDGRIAEVDEILQRLQASKS